MTIQNDLSAIDLRALRRSCAGCSLRTFCLPAGIDGDALPRLDAVVRKPPPLKHGQMVFRAGEAFEQIYVVRSGSLKTVQTADDGERQIMGFHLTGELLGLDAISGEHHRSSAIALERTSICAIPFSRLEAVAAQLPSLQRQLHRVISREMVHEQEHVATMGRRTARARLAAFLCILSRRLAEVGYSATDFRLGMSRENIANYLRLAPETVSRVCKALSEEGLVQFRRRQVRVLDPEALAALAGCESGMERERMASGP